MRTMIGGCALALALGAPWAQAAGWYVSAAGGNTSIESGLAAGHGIDFDASSSFTMSHDRDTWRVAVGRTLSDRFALELNYTDYGRQRLEAFGSPNPVVFPVEVLSQSRSSERKVTAIGLDVVARIPFWKHVFLAARAGAAYV